MRSAYFAAMLTFSGALAVSSAALSWDQDPVSSYLQRSDKITLSAGNASHVNTVTHVIDPWPRYVGNRRIPGNGERMAGAVERYRDVNRVGVPPRLSPPAVIIGGAAGGGR